MLLTAEIDHRPRYERPDSARTVSGTYAGITSSGGKWYYAYRFRNPVWTGRGVYREVFVLAPAVPGSAPAVVGDWSPSAQAPEILGRLALPGPGAHRAWATVRPASSPLSSSPSPPLPREAAAGSNEYPPVLDLAVAHDGAIQSMRAAWSVREPGGERRWEWSEPCAISGRVAPPSTGEKVAGKLMPWGYLVTVPLDIVTLPIQVGGALVILVVAAMS